MSLVSVPQQSFLETLTNAIHLDYVLKVLGVGGFVWAFPASWHTLAIRLVEPERHELAFALREPL